MSCECKSKIEAALTKQHAERQPDATDHGARLEGYRAGINLKSGKVTTRPGMDYKVSAAHTVKATGRQVVKSKKGTMLFSFCPFCGVKIS